MDIELLLSQMEMNRLAFAIGFDQQGEPVITTLPQVIHLLLLGRSPMAQQQLWSILLQLATRNDPNHLQMVFLKNNETTALFRDLSNTVDPSSIAQTFTRWERQRRPFLLIVVEDLTHQQKGIEWLLREGRKWSIGMIATSPAPPSEMILANTTQAILPHSADLLDPWQDQIFSAAQVSEGTLFQPLGGHGRWLSPLAADTHRVQVLLRSYAAS